MNSSATDLKDILEAESSLGLTFQTDLFVGREPSSPNNCVTIFDTGGAGPAEQYSQVEAPYTYSRVQVRVRDREYTTGWDVIESIVEALHDRAGETWNGTLYCSIACSTGPAFFDWDENNRARFIVNFEIQRRNA